VASKSANRRTVLTTTYLIGLFLVIVTHFTTTVSSTKSPGGLPLNEFIRHFEPAFYEPILIPSLKKSNSGRQKRSSLTHHDDYTDVDDFDISYHAKPISFNVTAHNRLFRIKVHNNFAQEDDVFAEDAVVESTDGPIDASAIRKRIYSGILEDLPDASAVHGIVTRDGLFDGHISTPLEEYYIEPASRYFTNKKDSLSASDQQSDQPQKLQEQSPLFHSVIYKASDVVHPTASPASEDGSGEPPCKSHELHLRRKEAAAASKAAESSASEAAKVPTSSTSPRTSFRFVEILQ